MKDFIGNYTEYRSFIKDYEAAQSAKPEENVSQGKVKTATVRKLTWKEQQELKALEGTLAALEAEKSELEAKLSGGTLGLEELQTASARYAALKDELDAAEMRWLELSEI